MIDPKERKKQLDIEITMLDQYGTLFEFASRLIRRFNLARIECQDRLERMDENEPFEEFAAMVGELAGIQKCMDILTEMNNGEFEDAKNLLGEEVSCHIVLA